MANDSGSKPMYEQIFEALRDQIKAGKYAVGDRVPSEKELGDEFGVSRITSKKALELLAMDGYIVRQPGRGSFVAEPGRAGALASNAAASLPKQRRTASRRLIGLVMTDFGDAYGTGLVYGMEQASREHDSYLVLRRSFGIPANEEESIKGLLELGVDGLIIFPAQGEYFNAEILKLVIDKFPFVLVDRHLKGLSAGSICSDNVAGAVKGTNHLFDLGHKHIAFLTPPPMDTTAIEDRIEGFVQAHAEMGIVVDRDIWIQDITSTLPTAYVEENKRKDIEKMKEHLSRHPHITALFATEYNMALLAAEAVKQMGLSVPDDISIICFDSPYRNGLQPFTHLRQNQEEMGRLAFEHVLKLRDGETMPNRVLLDAELIIGNSTAKAKVRAN
ncbi:GntR family transcriptional regulator [Paenibacillus sp. LHD-117]|uniref:GntR family transcriptional regulator n=1 Tax=Paenibacillus sp. LHD-117 TaxID=3071412 RepID=UPI0027DF365E|nr:GntR family transcriptional regulator [Paenibacillus sp. LHD-117]MDQ6419741.1 GntR family transcriptional regulator [Paenibacillus sp. LHD-117]